MHHTHRAARLTKTRFENHQKHQQGTNGNDNVTPNDLRSVGAAAKCIAGILLGQGRAAHRRCSSLERLTLFLVAARLCSMAESVSSSSPPRLPTACCIACALRFSPAASVTMSSVSVSCAQVESRVWQALKDVHLGRTGRGARP